jgi:hypothetical protein
MSSFCRYQIFYEYFPKKSRQITYSGASPPTKTPLFVVILTVLLIGCYRSTCYQSRYGAQYSGINMSL